jgi:hypothetical protein
LWQQNSLQIKELKMLSVVTPTAPNTNSPQPSETKHPTAATALGGLAKLTATPANIHIELPIGPLTIATEISPPSSQITGIALALFGIGAAFAILTKVLDQREDLEAAHRLKLIADDWISCLSTPQIEGHFTAEKKRMAGLPVVITLNSDDAVRSVFECLSRVTQSLNSWTTKNSDLLDKELAESVTEFLSYVAQIDVVHLNNELLEGQVALLLAAVHSKLEDKTLLHTFSRLTKQITSLR